jgi:hypothetical protein
MLVLSQFVLRLSFGLATAMGLTSPRQVTSGYFRNHAYVLLGLNVLATLAAVANRGQLLLWPALAAAVLSYACSAAWLYEKIDAGKALLWGVAVAALMGALLAPVGPGALDAPSPSTQSPSAVTLTAMPSSARLLVNLNTLTAGLLLGSTIAAMFLGHWYLNTPTMELSPLRRLLLLMAAAVLARAIVGAIGIILEVNQTGLSSTQWLLVGLRWLAGIVGTAVLIVMSWETLKIPNTQSATGILYVAVLTTFLGELTSLLLSAGTTFPL